jgi:hypothetical protein
VGSSGATKSWEVSRWHMQGREYLDRSETLALATPMALCCRMRSHFPECYSAQQDEERIRVHKHFICG